MNNVDFSHLCLMSAGATLGTGLLFGAAHLGKRENDHYLPFAVACLAGTMVFLSLAALYQATSFAAAVVALHWHVTGVVLVLPAFVWLYARIARRRVPASQWLVVGVGSIAVLAANLASPSSLHFDSIAPAPPGTRLPDGRPIWYVGHAGWVSGLFHVWMLLVTWFAYVNARHVWRHGTRLVGAVAVASCAVFVSANVVATRADFSGGRTLYVGGLPMLFAVIMLLGLGLGVTERQQREAMRARGEELRAANARLQDEVRQRGRLEQSFAEAQRMESLGRMAAGVAHDFNNVLTVAGGHAELMRHDGVSGDEDRRHAEAIRDAVARGGELTRQLLAFARRQALVPAELDVDATLAGMRELLAALAGRQTRLELALGAPGRTIVADPAQFAQVIMNLAGNARDAMPEGGRLLIATAWLDAGAPGACACEGALGLGHVLLTVSDSGHGIDPETLPRIFEPFFTTKDPGKGTGLGLATVHGIVTQSGGHVAVESRPGEGTTFRICWPAAGAAAGVAGGARAVVQPA